MLRLSTVRGAIYSCILFAWATQSFAGSVLGERDLTQLSSDSISHLIASPDPLKNLDLNNPSSHLSKILIPRAPGTANNTLVKDYIVKTLKGLNWHVEEDTFTDDTPIGVKQFTNVIATKDPTAPRRVILSAHFDSKYFSTFPENQFVGAIDSAASCAMMLDLAESLNSMLDSRKKKQDDNLDDDDDVADTTLQLVFFDGEEAFVQWTATDSIYGARHLAEKWSTSYIPPHTKRRLTMNTVHTELSTIEHLILLDLLGAPQPMIRSYFPDTAWLHDELVAIEKRLGDSGAFAYGDEKSMAPGKWYPYFLDRKGIKHNYVGYIGDDHVPFLERGVSVLHLIAEPFPRVWHTLKDDAEALDPATMRRWNIILRVFLSEYLMLQPNLEGSRAVPVVQRSASEL